MPPENGEALKWSQAKQRLDLKGNKLDLFVRRLQEYRVDTNYQSNLLLAFLPSIVEDQEFEQAANAGSDGLDAEYRSADGGALLCSWVRNIYICHQLYEKAMPVIREPGAKPGAPDRILVEDAEKAEAFAAGYAAVSKAQGSPPPPPLGRRRVVVGDQVAH